MRVAPAEFDELLPGCSVAELLHDDVAPAEFAELLPVCSAC
jgi:hypothetical protein